MKPYWNHCWSTIVAQTLFFKQCLKRSKEIYFRNSTFSRWTVLSSQTLPRRSGTTALSSLSAPRQDRQDMKMWRDTGFKPSKKNGRDKRFQKSIDECSEKNVNKNYRNMKNHGNMFESLFQQSVFWLKSCFDMYLHLSHCRFRIHSL